MFEFTCTECTESRIALSLEYSVTIVFWEVETFYNCYATWFLCTIGWFAA